MIPGPKYRSDLSLIISMDNTRCNCRHQRWRWVSGGRCIIEASDIIAPPYRYRDSWRRRIRMRLCRAVAGVVVALGFLFVVVVGQDRATGAIKGRVHVETGSPAGVS